MDVATESVYEDRVVIFLDILGFKQLVASGQEATILEALHVPKNIQERGFHGAPSMRLTAFSDSIVVSDLVGDGFGFCRIVSYASYLVWKFLEKGVLVRGGIAHGKLHDANGVVFGPALNAAYELESKLAIYPRILVSDEVRTGHIEFETKERGLEQQGMVLNHYRSDFDGNTHLHILGHAALHPSKHLPTKIPNEYGSVSYSGEEIFQAKIRCLNEVLEKNKPGATNPSVKAKYSWLENYMKEAIFRRGW